MVFTLLCCIEISLAFYIYSSWTNKAQDLANRGEIVRGHPLKKLKSFIIKKRRFIQHVKNVFYTLDIRPFPKSKAKAGYNPNSNIVGRIWTWDVNNQVDKLFLTRVINQAISSRHSQKDLIDSDAMRLINAESDGLPGLVLDQYGDLCVVQFLTAAIEFWRDECIEIIIESTKTNCLYERSDSDARQLEGLPINIGFLFGKTDLRKQIITENEVKFSVDYISGHKTGLYLDQRENHLYSRNLSNGRKVLDCFSYTGGFAINALIGNASSVTLVDSSSPALISAKENLLLNNLSLECVNFIEQDVFKYLRFLRDTGETFDMVILDPPKFAPTASQVERAARGYKDINLLALKILRTGGCLMTFSCSGGVSEELFQKIIAGAALDAGVDASIIKRLHQAIDHPVALNFPESAYLKGFVVIKRN